ncbi:glycosyltransferase [uncultured Flavobacterium sp.]|uniref:glycosyltransferase n=1 Tax=uncultured Flavobacterium sp. TaxID=165435 RepID=UPI0030CA375A
MKILLIGEFSRLHNSLKEGLESYGHEVKIIANGDGFKNYAVDYSTKAVFFESKIGNILRQITYRITKFDIASLERGFRFYVHLNKLKGFDVVQFINEKPIQTIPCIERMLLKKVFNSNKKFFLLCCGVDYIVAAYMLEKKGKYSIMNPYFENPKAVKNYQYMLDFLTKSHKKTHDLMHKHIKGIIASDYDYVLPMKNHSKYLGLIANPINIQKNTCIETPIIDKIIIFLGINRSTYYAKGILFFEKALAIIKEKYNSKIELIVSENIPYKDYITLYNKAHIVLDQVYAYDQGYNALEAMAKGKVVFTGAESEFLIYYELKEDEVAINALPDVDYLVEKLSFLIENHSKIIEIGFNARKFIEKEHDYIKIAEKYLEKWAL